MNDNNSLLTKEELTRELLKVPDVLKEQIKEAIENNLDVSILMHNTHAMDADGKIQVLGCHYSIFVPFNVMNTKEKNLEVIVKNIVYVPLHDNYSANVEIYYADNKIYSEDIIIDSVDMINYIETKFNHDVVNRKYGTVINMDDNEVLGLELALNPDPNRTLQCDIDWQSLYVNFYYKIDEIE